MVAFVQGLQAGQRMAQGWVDTYEAARRRREEEDLKRRREEIMGAQPEDLGLRYSPEQAEQLRLAAESGQYDIGYGDGGYQVTPTADPRQTGLVAPEQRVSRFMGQEVEGGLTPQRTAEMRERALVDTIADPMERQRAMQGLRQGRLTDMQIAEAERGMQVREATQQAQQQLSQRIAQGDIPDVEQIFAIAAQTGADANELLQVAANAFGITDKKAESDTKKLVKEINESAVNPKKFNELLRKFDPNPEDNIVPELRVGRDGTHQVFYGEEPMSPAFRNTREMTAMAQLASHYRDSVSGAPLATAVQLATLKVKEAQIRASDAQVRASDAKAAQPRMRELTDFENTQLKAYNKWLEEPRNANAAQGVKDTKLRELGIPDIFVGRSTSQTGLRDWGDAGEGQPTPQPAAAPAAAPAMGLTREQTQARADQEMSEIQQQTRTRRTAIQTFERMPQVVQATQAARDLRRAGRAAEANNIEALINERRQEYVESQLR